MAQTTRPCDTCGADVFRTKPTGAIPATHPQCKPSCDIEGCEKQVHNKGLCCAHASRLAKFGDALAPKTRHPNVGACSVEGCDEPMRKTKLCAKHYAMWYRYGEIREWAYQWGQGGYHSTHNWVVRRRGRASSWACVDCGEAAEEWSYIGGRNEQVDADGRVFAHDANAYEPRCVRCHRFHDDNPIALQALGRAEGRDANYG